jgi:hypothetical protein
MDHVVVRIGDQDEVYGTVESTPRGFRYHPETPEMRKYLVGFIAEYRYGQDNRDGALYRWLPPDEFLRRLPHRFSGFFAWAYVVEDSQNHSQEVAQRAKWQRPARVPGLLRDECGALLAELEGVPGVEIMRVEEAAAGADVWLIRLHIERPDDTFTIANATFFRHAVSTDHFPGIPADAVKAPDACTPLLDEATAYEFVDWEVLDAADLDDLDALARVWSSERMQRLIENLARSGSPFAPGEVN